MSASSHEPPRVRLLDAVLRGPDARIRGQLTATRIALIVGVIFVPAGLVKFVFHHWELGHFRTFDLPWPAALEIIAGVLETAGGLLLILRRWVLPVGVLLSATMIVAIVSSGIGNGDVVPSLTLAPALLIGLLYLLRVGVREKSLSAGG